ncbi:MAG: dUTP diphosphatase [Coriobacteriia bacterium]|nr:dUTP diphosphatase [Coriobacteriia bacterium]
MTDPQHTLIVTRLREDAQLPHYAHDGDAGLDLYSVQEVTLEPFERALIPTGIALAIPPGYAGYVMPRSGLAVKYGLSLVNTPGLIDSGYRGEVQICAINLDAHFAITLGAGERIAQLVIAPYSHVTIKEVDTLDETQRNTGGFGSSGTR